jgi:hypothetical protein
MSDAVILSPEGLGLGASPNRMMVNVIILDADLKEHVFGPLPVEIPPQTGFSPWDVLHNQQIAAKAYLISDMECRVDLRAALDQLKEGGE